MRRNKHTSNVILRTVNTKNMAEYNNYQNRLGYLSFFLDSQMFAGTNSIPSSIKIMVAAVDAASLTIWGRSSRFDMDKNRSFHSRHLSLDNPGSPLQNPVFSAIVVAQRSSKSLFFARCSSAVHTHCAAALNSCSIIFSLVIGLAMERLDSTTALSFCSHIPLLYSRASRRRKNPKQRPFWSKF